MPGMQLKRGETVMDRTGCKSPIHGTGHAYRRKGCRCPDTMAAIAAAQQEYRDRKRRNSAPVLMDSTEAHRMLRALFAAGFTGGELSERLGYAGREGAVQLLRSKRVHPTTHARIQALYGALEAHRGHSLRTAGRARRKGWAVPFAWDPHTIDDPLCAPAQEAAEGRRSRAEILYEYTTIRDRGMSHAFALAELGVSHDAYTLMLRREGITPPKVKTERTPTRRASNGSLAGLGLD